MMLEENAYVCASLDCCAFWLVSSRQRVHDEINNRKLLAIKELIAAGFTSLDNCESLGDLLHLVDYMNVRRLDRWERKFLARFRQSHFMYKFYKLDIYHDESLYASYWANQMSSGWSLDAGARVRETRKGLNGETYLKPQP